MIIEILGSEEESKEIVATRKMKLELELEQKRAVFKSIQATAIETAVIMAYSVAIDHYRTHNTSWYLKSVTTSAIGLVINFLLRINCTPEDEVDRRFVRLMHSVIFSMMDMTTRGTLLHEWGHAIVANTLFENANAHIEIYPSLLGGATTYYTNELSTLGNLIGYDQARMLTSAAGSGANMLWGYTALIAAQVISDEYPDMQSHLRWSTFFEIFRVIIYALSAYNMSECGAHDFCKLDEYGISPAVAVPAILGSVLLLQTLLTGSRLCHRSEKNEDVFQDNMELGDIDSTSSNYTAEKRSESLKIRDSRNSFYKSRNNIHVSSSNAAINQESKELDQHAVTRDVSVRIKNS